MWIASAASHIGSYMTDVGQGWLMSSLTPSPLVVSLLLTAESLPFFALGLPAGALADIVDRRRLLIITQVAMAVAVGALAVVTFTGVVTPWMLLALAFGLGIATALNDPAWHAVIPELLPPDELAAGVTLSGVGVNVARTVGPALGGFVVAVAGPALVFVLDALSFLGVVGALFMWKRQRVPTVLPAEADGRRDPRGAALRAKLGCSAARAVCHISIHGMWRGGDGIDARARARDGARRGRLRPAARVARRRGGERRHDPPAITLAIRAAGADRGRIDRPRGGRGRRGDAARPLRALPNDVHRWCCVGVGAVDAHRRGTAGEPAVGAGARGRGVSDRFPGWDRGERTVGICGIGRGAERCLSWYCGGLALGAALAVRLRPAGGAAEDHTPAHHWPAPIVLGEPPLEAGPIMVQVEYRVDPPRLDDFRRAVAEMGRNRRRDGAVQWWLFQDTADPSRFVETWIEMTWAEHLRYHDRVSVTHQALEQRVRGLLRSGSVPVTRHFVAPASRPAVSN